MTSNNFIYKSQKTKCRFSKRKYYLSFLFVVLVVIFLYFNLRDKRQNLNNNQQQNHENTIQTKTKIESQPQDQQKKIDLQPVIDSFTSRNPGNYGIEIIDTNGNKLAEENPDKQFFTASIYKLFVAYVGYQRIDDKTFSKDDSYLTGYTRGQCLDAMIRDSYSPCAEKMWNELGKDKLTSIMQDYGLKNTSLTGLNTSASDTAIILRKIANGEGLSAESQQAFLSSMDEQEAKYRRGLPAGFSKLKVYNKVGWDEDRLWHDASIVQLENGQKIIVCVFTTGLNSSIVAKLGGEIEKTLE